MKVITEERLLQRLNDISEKEKLDRPYIVGKVQLLNDLIDECQEIDTLTVSKLRPMCDAPKDGTLIEVWHKKSPDPRETYFCDGFYIIDDCDVPEIELSGWLPKPIYKPELAGDGG